MHARGTHTDYAHLTYVRTYVHVKPSSQYGKNARRAFDATLKRKDRIDFYPCVADAPVDASDRTCHKFIADISFVIIVRNPLDAW